LLLLNVYGAHGCVVENISHVVDGAHGSVVEYISHVVDGAHGGFVEYIHMSWMGPTVALLNFYSRITNGVYGY
jgi:hypothetical protein